MADKTTVPGMDIPANTPDLAVETELGLSTLRGPIDFVRAREELAVSSAVAQMPTGELAQMLGRKQVETILGAAAGHVSGEILSRTNSEELLSAARGIGSVAFDKAGRLKLAA